MTRLVTEPLAKIGVGDPLARLLRKPLVIVVDALDECSGDSDIDAVLGLISSAESSRLRIFFTCRPETPIQYGILSINEASRQVLVLHHIDPRVVNRDIYAYLGSKLRRVGRELLRQFWVAQRRLVA